uniref:Uncharacterized protein n=1 Tax=Mycena chlorophos TaxID=658473 RepID=A0ABQ0L5W4_MYCCL|nr:predicted protein [Mycena chlorophos]
MPSLPVFARAVKTLFFLTSLIRKLAWTSASTTLDPPYADDPAIPGLTSAQRRALATANNISPSLPSSVSTVGINSYMKYSEGWILSASASQGSLKHPQTRISICSSSCASSGSRRRTCTLPLSGIGIDPNLNKPSRCSAQRHKLSKLKLVDS